MLLRIVSILFPLFALTALGYLVGRRQRPDLSHANKLNMDVFVPALVFAALANKSFHVADFVPLLGATLFLVGGCGLAGWALARGLGVAPRTLVPPLMFNNCGNLGLPLAVLAFGDQALAPAVAMFMVSNLLHFSFGAWLLDHSISVAGVWKVPSVLATLAGIAVGLLGIEVWAPAMTAIRMLGDISIPLMLFALGVRLTESRIGELRLGLIGAAARPLIGMALALLAMQLIPLSKSEQALLLVFGALPPAVLNYIFAERYHQEPEKVASIVLLGNVAALLFLPVALAIGL
ncbi:MAG TPA: AEC family transporter [Zoogloea sp.]|uniref:AEC family transporter n=1 Tax=Zoogloea sp. TaxID=49181 RepID=UPI002BC9E157|nr:AEC family transporter [Zoogloea sp.]HMV64862.1 AEC family transporter [Rhodocyclaceae bacterium]HMW52510.1 AEC family transporter [Rhodocyclaceae bacterium]HMY50387.1 AEC family transporter [Rhodocyclaceae bacterium]HMZ76462.1 AEC family transporter [Rhodocyclaceae bacterium]HNA68332.1 AEC family transporter [Rhodocyclaceae bacterium]